MRLYARSKKFLWINLNTGLQTALIRQIKMHQRAHCSNQEFGNGKWKLFVNLSALLKRGHTLHDFCVLFASEQ